jgi:hypothetical protein
MMVKLRLFGTLLAAGLPLAACSTAGPDPFLTTQAVAPVAAPIATEVAGEFAAAYLTSLAGSIQTVRQSVSHDSLHQEVVYENRTALAGENLLTVDVGRRDQAGFMRPPSASQIAREMRAALPGVNASISPLLRQNSRGTYGYATASYGNGGACLYAWQHVKAVTPADSIGFDKLTRARLSAQIRLRFCHPGLSADQIVALMDTLTLKDMNSQTIDMLRFAAGSGSITPPVAKLDIDPTPEKPRRKIIRTAKVEAAEDWRTEAQKPATVVEEDGKVIANAVAVPLPDNAAPTDAGDATKLNKSVTDQPIANPVSVPLPQ